MKKVFVVGGDGDAIGTFKDGVDLVRAVHESGQPLDEIGVPAYPEGHSAIPNDALMQALKDKQPHAQTMATQMAFNPNEVGEWILKVRSEGVTLPLYLGVPGVVELTKLMRIATQIGVADSARYLSKNTGLLGHIASAGSFGPDAFLRSLAPIIEQPDSRAHHRRSGGARPRSARVYVQLNRHDSSVAEADAGGAGGLSRDYASPSSNTRRPPSDVLKPNNASAATIARAA
jgi:5,10-methylenetetrahydrofolate reductase